VRNIRVGITEAYVEFVRELGTEWLEKNLAGFLSKVLGIVAQPKVRMSKVFLLLAESTSNERC